MYKERRTNNRRSIVVQ